MIYIVAGLPRSGTSLMMKMLHEGGLEVFAREYNSYETQCMTHLNAWDYSKLNNGERWLPAVEGKAIKVLHPYIYALSREFQYKIIWMDRNPKDQAKSQKKFLLELGEKPRKDYVPIYTKQNKKDTRNCIDTLHRCENIELLRVSFDSLVRGKNAGKVCAEIVSFIGPVDPVKMEECIHSRSRFEKIPVGKLEMASATA